MKRPAARPSTRTRTRRLALDLVHEGVGPIYGHVGQARRRQRLRARALRAAHEASAARSQVDGEPAIQLRGHGLRDHSWGPRYWQSTPSYRWITGNFGDDLGMVISIVGDRVGGVFHKGEELLPHHDVELDTDYETGTKLPPRAARDRDARERRRSTRSTARCKGFIPLRNRRAGHDTHIGEGMTEYVLDGERVGYGLSEYLDQPEG